MIDPRLAPLLAEALSLKMDVSLKLSDGEYDIFYDGFGRILATQEGVCDWLDAEIGAYCKSKGRVRDMPSFAGPRHSKEPLLISMLYDKFSDEEREALLVTYGRATTALT